MGQRHNYNGDVLAILLHCNIVQHQLHGVYYFAACGPTEQDAVVLLV